ncbi:response regulator [Roseomonas chloroacetimidivorans]|jgi:two-component SAPR family response regulator|uniref:response regulator n=1 Tax=Roseomonas chloroacetimidivorans TaxID=1766656 RepID=UPI003C7754CD
MTAAGNTTRPLAGRSVLVVEDQYLIADELCTMVEQLGGRVLGPAPNITSAFALLTEDRADLALLDVNLDGEEVYPLAEALQRVGTPLVFTTGYGHRSIDPRFADAPHLEKPIGLQVLTEVLRRLSLA